MSPMRQVLLQHPQPCDECGIGLVQGDLIAVNETGTVVCAPCILRDEPALSHSQGLGVPGRSAQREYERRRRNEHEAARRDRPYRLVIPAIAVVGGYLAVQVMAAVLNAGLHTHGVQSPKPPMPAGTAHGLGVIGALVAGGFVAQRLWGRRQSTDAWARGAQGEMAVAARLAKVPGVVVLHDRLIPGSRVNIDHIVVGSSGVFLIDSKVRKGRVAARRVGSIWNPGPTKLFVGGRNRTSYVDGMARQLAAVSQALAQVPEAAGVAVQTMVVIVGAEWGFFPRPCNVQGVWVGWPKEAAKVVGRHGPLSVEERQRLAQELMARLPMA